MVDLDQSQSHFFILFFYVIDINFIFILSNLLVWFQFMSICSIFYNIYSMNLNPNARLIPNNIFNDENNDINYGDYKKSTPIKKPFQEHNNNLSKQKQHHQIKSGKINAKPVALDIKKQDDIGNFVQEKSQKQTEKIEQNIYNPPQQRKRKVILDFQSDSAQQNLQSMDAPRQNQQSDQQVQFPHTNILQSSYQTNRAQRQDLFDQPTYRQRETAEDVIFEATTTSHQKNSRKKFILQIDEQQSDQYLPEQGRQQDSDSIQKSKDQQKISINPKKQFILANFDESDDQQSQVVREQNQNGEDAFQIIKPLNFNLFFKENPDFLFTHIPKDTVIQCIIRRDKAKQHGDYVYQVYDSTLFKHIVTVRKTQKGCYQFFKKRSGENKSIACLKSNFFGTSFQCFKAPYETYNQIVSITYETNIFGLKGPRKMKVYIPKECKEINNEKNLQSLYTKDSQNIEKFYNKSPKWSSELGAYVLNFKGRATLPSVKNFLIINDENPSKMFLLFGKARKQVFNMDIKYPFSIIQAISVAVSSFDKKLACQ